MCRSLLGGEKDDAQPVQDRLVQPCAPPHARPGDVSSRCSKTVGVVRWRWIRRDHGVLHAEDVTTLDRRISSHHRRIVRKPRTACRVPDPFHGGQLHHHVGCDRDDSSALWVFHELVWPAAGRRVRVSPARDWNEFGVADCRRGQVVSGSDDRWAAREVMYNRISGAELTGVRIRHRRRRGTHNWPAAEGGTHQSWCDVDVQKRTTDVGWNVLMRDIKPSRMW